MVQHPMSMTYPILTRRDLLIRGTAGLVALAGFRSEWAVARAQAISIVATPAQTEGPYFVDERLNRSDIRIDPSNSAVSTGFPMVLGISVSRIANGAITPLSGAYVDIWHCNASGVYSDVQANSTVGMKFLRGYQITNTHGNARFLTVYPGWYSGRTVHIHFKVRLFNGNSSSFEFTSQLYFDESITNLVYATSPYSQRPNRDTTNARDGIYSSGGTQLMLRLARDSSYALSSFHVMLNGV